MFVVLRGANEKQGRRAKFNYYGAEKELCFITREMCEGKAQRELLSANQKLR